MSSVVGALIGTYFLSRALLYAFSGLRGWQRLFAAHFVSLLLLALLTGFVKNYFVFFPVEETFVYVLPQLLWLILDVATGKASRAAA